LLFGEISCGEGLVSDPRARPTRRQKHAHFRSLSNYTLIARGSSSQSRNIRRAARATKPPKGAAKT
jgi:hypothetical protein